MSDTTNKAFLTANIIGRANDMFYLIKTMSEANAFSYPSDRKTATDLLADIESTTPDYSKTIGTLNNLKYQVQREAQPQMLKTFDSVTHGQVNGFVTNWGMSNALPTVVFYVKQGEQGEETYMMYYGSLADDNKVINDEDYACEDFFEDEDEAQRTAFLTATDRDFDPNNE